MPEKVTISYRGEKYELGRCKRYYGIWVTGAPSSDPVDRWPLTNDGWTQAWARYTAIETPGTIAAVAKPRGSRSTAAAALLGIGVLLGVIGLFPDYVGQSLASQGFELAPHLIYLVAWAASAAVIALGARGGDGRRTELLRIGALLGTGLSAVTFGLFLFDLGQVISGGAHLLGTGLVLSLIGWLACAAGSVLALTARPRAAATPGSPAIGWGGPGRPRPATAGPLALVLLAAIGAVSAFAPAWDSFTLKAAATGTVQTVTAGNAFSNPGAMIAGDVIAMIAVVVVALLAALWRPVRHGAVLLAGATVPLAAQAISALIQVSEPVSPALFGISSAQASAAGLTISAGVTPIFWVYCVFVISLVVSCAWMLTAPRYPAMPTAPQSPPPGPPQPSQDVADEVGDSDGGAEDDEESTYA